ncbi:MAG: hypothetical protein HPY50_16560 [Firmicutes bacterium]|nr:hypothetical protein [Bacillota bacterium]
MAKRFWEDEDKCSGDPVITRRRRMKVIAGPDLGSVEQSLKDWLSLGRRVSHLQIDHLPNQPHCQRWQAIITYYPEPGAERPPKLQCRRCVEKESCARHQAYLERKVKASN